MQCKQKDVDRKRLIEEFRQNCADETGLAREVVDKVVDSTVFRRLLKSAATGAGDCSPDTGDSLSRKACAIRLAYQAVLNRDISEMELEERLAGYRNCEQLLEELTASKEYAENNFCLDANRAGLIRLFFREILGREISKAELADRLKRRQTGHGLVHELLHSEEYRVRKQRKEVDLSRYLGTSLHVLGDSRPLTTAALLEWYRSAAELLLSVDNTPRPRTEATAPGDAAEVVIVTSLYRGGSFIRTFLDSITSQSYFGNCVLYIVDANSPDNEHEIISEYQARFPNIKYERFPNKIGIYKAWNHAINNSRSKYLINANVDDLHRFDAIEKKAGALNDNPGVDVVYSDCHYSFLPNLSFEVFSRCGITTNLPVANKDNLLELNSPHNSPMWRRSLHDEIGLFDSGYRSAGDYEFWLRAAFAGKKFLKIPDSVTGYLHNPDGVSTKRKTPGVEEGQIIRSRYSDLKGADEERKPSRAGCCGCVGRGTGGT